MKFRIFTICFLVHSFLTANAQEFKVRDIVTFVASVPVVEGETTFLSMTEDMETLVVEYLEPNVNFYIVAIDSMHVKLRAPDFKKISSSRRTRLEDNNIAVQGDYYNGKFYTITLENFIAFAEKVEPKDKISIGLLTLPFKARPQDDFSFDTQFNLNSTLNIRFGDVSGVSYYYQFGAGVGSVNLNPGNAGGVSDSETQDVSVLTFFNGIMLEYKKIQVGVYAGFDQINNQKNYDWQSNGNVWLGFGIGYNLFKLASSEPANVQSGG